MKKKLIKAGMVLGLVIISMVGYKTVANVKDRYDKYISNDIVGENIGEDKEDIAFNKEDIALGNENTVLNNDNRALDSDKTQKENEEITNDKITSDKITSDYNSPLNEEFVAQDELNPIAHDSDLSSEIEKSEEEKEEEVVAVDAAGTDAVEAALNISNPTLDLDATSALLMDAKTGKVIYHKNATDKVYPASTVKIMTALIALDECKKEEEITIGDEISLIASDSSNAGLDKGEKLTVKMLLEALLLPSGNDAAYSIATYVGRKVSKNDSMEAKDAVNVFVGLMNKKAKSLGLKNTNFMNPDGYDHDKQYTTAYDMAIIAKEALQNDVICEISKMQRARNIFLSGEDVTWKSGNKLLRTDSDVYYKYAIGLKSGTTSLAGRCMVSAAKKEDKTYISVIMNSTSLGRWEDSLTLLKYGIEN